MCRQLVHHECFNCHLVVGGETVDVVDLIGGWGIPTHGVQQKCGDVGVVSVIYFPAVQIYSVVDKEADSGVG